MSGKSSFKVQLDPALGQAELQAQMRELAQEIASGLSALEPAQSKNLLGDFVSELFVSVTEQANHLKRRQKQRACIAAAMERGVKFGRPVRPLPDNFQECREAWRGGQMTLREAAKACGMAQSSFRDAVVRVENAV